MLQYVRTHLGFLAEGHIRRIADHQIESSPGLPRQDVATFETDAAAAKASVSSGDGQHRLGNVDPRHVGIGQFRRKRHGDATASRPDVENPHSAASFVSVDDATHHLLGLRTRNQHPFADGELPAEKIGEPGNILGRATVAYLGQDVGQVFPVGTGSVRLDDHIGKPHTQPSFANERCERPRLPPVVNAGGGIVYALPQFASGHRRSFSAKIQKPAAPENKKSGRRPGFSLFFFIRNHNMLNLYVPLKVKPNDVKHRSDP